MRQDLNRTPLNLKSCGIIMFFLNRCLKTELSFTPYDMDKLHSDEQILKRLKEKIEGRCHPEYGYIIQYTRSPQANSPLGFDIGVPKTEDGNLIVTVTFSAITFKAEKNDIIDVIVTEIQQEHIKGKIGHAQVLIPRTKMPKMGCEYRMNENIFIFRDQNDVESRIEKDSKVRCKCFDIKTEMNFQMKIIATIDEKLINSLPPM